MSGANEFLEINVKSFKYKVQEQETIILLSKSIPDIVYYSPSLNRVIVFFSILNHSALYVSILISALINIIKKKNNNMKNIFMYRYF